MNHNIFSESMHETRLMWEQQDQQSKLQKENMILVQEAIERDKQRRQLLEAQENYKIEVEEGRIRGICHPEVLLELSCWAVKKLLGF